MRHFNTFIAESGRIGKYRGLERVGTKLNRGLGQTGAR